MKNDTACGDGCSFVPTETKAGMKVSNLYISQVKRKCGIEVGKNYNLPKNEDSRQPQCPEDKESAIVEALKHFNIIYSKNSPSSTGGLLFTHHVTVNGVNQWYLDNLYP